jgi:hypothetical protein
MRGGREEYEGFEYGEREVAYFFLFSLKGGISRGKGVDCGIDHCSCIS